MSYDFDNTVREWSYTMQKLNQQDLDRNFSLATTHLVKWMQAVRIPASYRTAVQLYCAEMCMRIHAHPLLTLLPGRSYSPRRRVVYART